MNGHVTVTNEDHAVNGSDSHDGLPAYQHPMDLQQVRQRLPQVLHSKGMCRLNTRGQLYCLLQFRKRAHEAVDYICDYYDRVGTLPVRSSVEVTC